jgi:DNA-binding transcriptional LysR family regulator
VGIAFLDLAVLSNRRLTDQDARPRIAVRGHFTTAPEIVRHSDLAALFPRVLALNLYRAADFRLLNIPFDLPAIEVKVHSHARFANDTRIRWMFQTSAVLRGDGSTGAAMAAIKRFH